MSGSSRVIWLLLDMIKVLAAFRENVAVTHSMPYHENELQQNVHYIGHRIMVNQMQFGH